MGVSRLISYESTTHIPKFGGNLWFVSGTSGSDSNTGTSPTDAFATIGAGISAMSTGDALTVMAGTYTETGLDLNVNNCEMWFEIGAILNPASGVPLTISANYCWVGCHDGSLRVNNDAGANTGILITGNWVYLEDIRVANASTGDIGYDIQGDGCDLRRCRTSDPLTAAYKIQGDTCKLEDCCTGGTVGNTSIGYWVTNSCDKFRIIDCGSQGHSTAGYQVDAGCTNGVVSYSHSGAGDGERIDNGTLTHWTQFESVSGKEQHFHTYPRPDGEGTAGDPISVTTDAQDETNGAASTANYFGEPKAVVSPTVFTVLWSWYGVHFFADTSNKIFSTQFLRINYGQSSAKNGGNAWDEGATVLTVADGSKFATDDLVWIYSDYKTDGEIVRVTNVATNVVTIERETSQFGAANTGLRWDHTTNDAGTEVMYRVYRSSSLGLHDSNIAASFGSSKDSAVNLFPEAREFAANDGLLVRLVNQTDNTNGAGVDLAIVYREGGN
jgi:hypothetical protein